MKISVVIPAYNEERNILPLYKMIKSTMGKLDYEVIIVDDASTDDTYEELKRIEDRRFRVMRLRRHRGKCFALYEGIKMSQGEIIATLDSDLQNDPKDILKMLGELGKGYDCICGWRYERRDGFVKRTLSRVGNFLNNKIFGLSLHDTNCPVKVFRRDCITKIKYFKHFHRFIPAIIKLQGFRIGELKVNHYPRIHGVSKYGVLNRVFCTLRTMVVVRFRWRKWLNE